MPEFSEVLRQRLASREVAQDHPDAGMLTAYLENLLPMPERNQVLEHLAVCRDCRDIAVLAFGDGRPDPAVQHEVAAAPLGKRSHWAWRPAFGLAASVAAIAVVATVLIRLPHQQHAFSPQQQARVQSPQPASAPVAQPAPEKADDATGVVSPAIDTGAAKPRETREHAERLARARTTEPRTTASVAALADNAQASPAPPVIETQSHIAAIVAAAPPRRDYLNQNVFAANSLRNAPPVGEIPAATALDQNGIQSAQLSLFRDLSERPIEPPAKTLALATSPGHNGFLSLPKIAEKAKKFVQRRSLPIGGGALTFSTMGGKGQFNPATGSAVEENATSAAEQKQSIELDQTQAFTARALSPSGAAGQDTAAAAPKMWVVADGKLLKPTDTGTWVNGYNGPEKNIDFSAVAMRGSEIWAGGNHAVLLHSRDAGATWERVRLGENAAGSITSIVVSGPAIQVQTSENQSWSSDDGGKTWTQN